MGQAKKLWMEMEERGDWPLDSLQQKDVCACHFEDEYLKKMVTDKGHHGTCSYCGKKDVVRNMYDFGEDIAWKVGLYFVNPVRSCLNFNHKFCYT